jgi:hypothetical protein
LTELGKSMCRTSFMSGSDDIYVTFGLLVVRQVRGRFIVTFPYVLIMYVA